MERGRWWLRFFLVLSGSVLPVLGVLCNDFVVFFTLFSKIKGLLKNVLLKNIPSCVTLHPSIKDVFRHSARFSS